MLGIKSAFSHDMTKRPFNIEIVLKRIQDAVEQYAAAAMFELRDQGYGTLFQQLIGCILSIRTLDEVSLPASIQLLKRAKTPQRMLALSVKEIDAVIHDVSFHLNKAEQIHEIAQRIIEEYDGELPGDFDVLTSFRGVGPKCASLALGVALQEARISVDIHVWRITNRWGYIQASTPERAIKALEQKLPKSYWIEINRLLVPFGKHICTGVRPRCSTCPVLEYCQQIGVTSHR